MNFKYKCKKKETKITKHSSKTTLDLPNNWKSDAKANVAKVKVAEPYNIKDIVSFSGPFWKFILRFFFITKYSTIVSIFSNVFIGIISY